MKLLWREDIKQLLNRRQQDQSRDVRQLLDQVRKHCNPAYKGVVQGSRPSRADKADQEIAASMSRQSAKEYWLARMNGDV